MRPFADMNYSINILRDMKGFSEKKLKNMSAFDDFLYFFFSAVERNCQGE